MSARTMHCELRHGILVEVHSEAAPSDEEWEELLQLSRVGAEGGLGCVVVSDGGAPNAAQRKKLAALEHSRTVPVAVVTPSMLTRGAVTALHWLGQRIRAFSPDAIDAALVYANVPEEKRDEILTLIADLKCRLMGKQLSDLTAGATDSAAMAERVVKERVRRIHERIASPSSTDGAQSGDDR